MVLVPEMVSPAHGRNNTAWTLATASVGILDLYCTNGASKGTTEALEFGDAACFE